MAKRIATDNSRESSVHEITSDNHWPLKFIESQWTVCLDELLANFEISFALCVCVPFFSLRPCLDRCSWSVLLDDNVFLALPVLPSIVSNKRHNKCSVIWHNRKIMIALKRNQTLMRRQNIVDGFKSSKHNVIQLNRARTASTAEFSRCLRFWRPFLCTFCLDCKRYFGL